MGFPSSPSNNDIYTSASGIKYIYLTNRWKRYSPQVALGDFETALENALIASERFQSIRILDDISADFGGANVTFDLRYNTAPVTIGNKDQLLVTISDTIQPEDRYSYANGQITFSEAPLDTDTCEIRLAASTFSVGVPDDATVTGEKLADNFTFIDGVSFGSANATTAVDLSRHIALYSNTHGINVTGNTTLNFVAAGYHAFYVGGSLALIANTTGIYQGSSLFEVITTDNIDSHVTSGVPIPTSSTDFPVGSVILATDSGSARTWNNDATIAGSQISPYTLPDLANPTLPGTWKNISGYSIPNNSNFAVWAVRVA